MEIMFCSLPLNLALKISLLLGVSMMETLDLEKWKWPTAGILDVSLYALSHVCVL